MAKYIAEIHEFVNFLTGKGQTGYFSPEEIDNAVYEASKDLFNDRYAQYEQTQKLSDDLSPFKTDPTPLTLDGNGQVLKPTEYLYAVAVTSGTTNVKVEIIEEAFVGNELNDPLCGPETGYPICVFYKTYIQFYPISGLTNIKITYLKSPVKPLWAYTVVNGRPVYDNASSVDVEWNAQNIRELTTRTLKYLGVTLREGELVQFAQASETKVI